jgi:nitrite reductase/ring-hydroxylating ferredoxin subunit
MGWVGYARGSWKEEGGAVLAPPAQKSVPSYKVVVEGDYIKVEV